jgi:hypothetical protein
MKLSESAPSHLLSHCTISLIKPTTPYWGKPPNSVWFLHVSALHVPLSKSANCKYKLQRYNIPSSYKDCHFVINTYHCNVPAIFFPQQRQEIHLAIKFVIRILRKFVKLRVCSHFTAIVGKILFCCGPYLQQRVVACFVSLSLNCFVVTD